MAKVSVIMSARNESYLPRMLDDLFAKLTGDFEIIVIQDGEPYIQVQARPRLTVVYGKCQGLKPNINQAALMANGKYILKFDAHCAVSEGIDETLQRGMQPNWIVVPRFYVLDAENWKWQDERFYDYFFLHCPLTDPKGYRFKAGGHWTERTQARLNVAPLDETMMIHGSCYFMERDFFLNKLGGLSSEGYDTFGFEHVEPAAKTWLGPWDGRVMVNKGCWYAHMHKGGQRPRGYYLSPRRIRDSYKWAAEYWMENKWQERAHDLEWLIDRFMPIPTWTADWRDLQARYLASKAAA